MKKRIFLLGALFTAFIGINSLNAQDFTQDSVNINDNNFQNGEKMVVKKGSPKRLVGKIVVITPDEINKYDNVYFTGKDDDYIFEKLSNDIEKIIDANRKNKSVSSDQNFVVVADSIILEKSSDVLDNGNINDAKKIEIWHNGDVISKSYSTEYDITDITLKSLQNILKNHQEKADKDGDKCCPAKKKKKLAESNLAVGYGYLNFSKDGFYSTPNAKDPYALKWSDKWDIMATLSFFPDNRIGFTAGLGLQSNVFRFDDGFSIDAFSFQPEENIINKEKCKLVARYITVPLTLDIRINKHIGIHAGGLFGLNYRNSHTGFKRQYKIDGERIEQSTGSSFKDFNTFKADLMLGIEVYGWTFYAAHSLTDMFKTNYGKDAMPFSFGIMIGY